MLTAVLALGASVAWGVGDFMGGLKSRTLPPLAVLAVAQPIGLAAIAIAVAIHWEPWPGGSTWLAAPAAVLATVGLVAFFRGMAAGSISLVAPIAATGALVPVAYGLAIGERPGSLQLLGIVLAVGGAVVTSYERSEGERPRLAVGVPWALLAAVGFGAFFIPMHAASEGDFLWSTLVFRSSSTTLVLLAVLLSRPRLSRSRQDLPVLAAIGLADTGGNVLFAAAAAHDSLVSVVSVLASLYPVVTVALARLYLRERVGRVQEAGAAVTLAGVVLVSAG